MLIVLLLASSSFDLAQRKIQLINLFSFMKNVYEKKIYT